MMAMTGTVFASVLAVVLCVVDFDVVGDVAKPHVFGTLDDAKLQMFLP